MTSLPTSPAQDRQSPLRAQLFDLIGSMRVTQLIYVAAKLGIADQLTDGPKHIDELAATAAVDSTALYRVLRALSSQGIFAETGECHFALTPHAELLREDVPGSLRAWALLTDGVSRLQTNKHPSTCWPYCHGHPLPPSWLKACNPARNGGVYDHHHRVYHGVVL
jgi:hypothetical protein